MGNEGRAALKDRKDGDEDDQVDVSCFLGRQPSNCEDSHV